MEGNTVELISKDDWYKVLINGVEINDITSISLYKQSYERTEVTITFNCNLETKSI